MSICVPPIVKLKQDTWYAVSQDTQVKIGQNIMSDTNCMVLNGDRVS